MNLIILSDHSKVAARLRNSQGRIKNDVRVTVSAHSPESIILTGALPRTRGWRIVKDVPIRTNGRKDYIKFLQDTKETEVWIKLSTSGGRSKIYVR